MDQLFSIRNGYKDLPSIQLESMNDTLKGRIWNVLGIYVFKFTHLLLNYTEDKDFFKEIWLDYFKYSINSIRNITCDNYYINVYQGYILMEWNSVYDFVEFISARIDDSDLLEEGINKVLEEESAGYRLLSGKITPITDKEQLNEVEEALQTKRSGVREHLETALQYLSDKKSPDYRNSIKESISAVETLAREYTGKPSATLGALIKILDDKSKGKLHPAFKVAIEKLYAYTSDKGGIRHSLMEKSDIESSEARFMLITCSAFINYCEQVLETPAV